MKNLELGFPHLIFDLSLIIQILEFIIHHIPDKRIKVSISIQQQLDFFYSDVEHHNPWGNMKKVFVSAPL